MLLIITAEKKQKTEPEIFPLCWIWHKCSQTVRC